MAKVAVDTLEPGTLVEIPESIVKAGYSKGIGMYAGASGGKPAIATYLPGYPDKTHLAMAMETEVEVVKDVKFQKKFVKDLWKGDGAGMPYQYNSGTDPEVFVIGEKGKVIPARMFLDKKTPFTAMFYDGIQAEVAPVSGSCLEGLFDKTHKLLREVLAKARQYDKSAKLTIKNAVMLTPGEVAKLSKEDLMFRCSTSLNIYNDGGELPDAESYPWRFAGGHIHIGCGPKPEPVIKAMVRSLDGILGVAGVSLAEKLDNPERRRMYGRAGEFRLPKHGLEYRVLSNFWLCSPAVSHLTFEIARMAYRMGEGGIFSHVFEGDEQEVRDCINWHDVASARKLIKRNEAIYKWIFSKKFHATDLQNLAMNTLMNGVEVAVDPNEIEKNWYLTPEKAGSWREYGRVPQGQWAWMRA